MYLPRSVARNAALSSGLLEDKKFSELVGLRGLKTKEARLLGAVKVNSSGANDIPRVVDTFFKSTDLDALFLQVVLFFNFLSTSCTDCNVLAVIKKKKRESVKLPKP